jgi:hypothetical protein
MRASKIYTPNMFDLFKVELFQSGSYIVKEVTDGHRFIVKHIFAEKREKWSRTEFEVIFDSQRETFKCECDRYNHMGMLCCHALQVMAAFHYFTFIVDTLVTFFCLDYVYSKLHSSLDQLYARGYPLYTYQPFSTNDILS